MSDAWFSWHLAPDGDITDGCHPEEAAALKDYLNSSSTTPEAAARAITAPMEAEMASFDEYSNLSRLWSLMIDALTDLPEQRDRVIELLKAIQSSLTADCKRSKGERQRIQWSNLPSFAHLWADRSVDNWRGSSRKWGPEQREGVRQDFILQARIETQLFLAQLNGFDLAPALGMICDALECKDAVLDYEIPAAKEWFTNVGEPLREGSKGEMVTFLRQRDLWDGESTSMSRWDFWKSRLQSIAESQDSGPEVREAARTAYEATETLSK